jgi:site-specific DNA-methyltransferase (adenine-specific)
MKTVPDGTFDLIIADPPYFEIHGDFDFVWASLDDYLDWSKKWITEAHRVLKTTGSFYLWGKIGFGKGFALFKLADWFESENLFLIRNWITQRNTRGRGTKRGYMEAREELVFATKSDNYTWNPAYTAEKSNRTDLGADGKPRKNEFKRVSDVWIDIAEASQSSHQRFRLSDGTSFPTVKALGLCERIIAASSHPGDRVFIPFGGSGSEAVACHKLSRQWDLTEIDQRFIEEIILPRLQKETVSSVENEKISQGFF